MWTLLCSGLVLERTWVCLPAEQKSQPTTDAGLWGRKAQTAFITGYQARRMGSSCLKDPYSLLAFDEGLLKATFGVRVVGGMNFF